jgi:hypothetical protein
MQALAFVDAFVAKLEASPTVAAHDCRALQPESKGEA